MAKDRALDRHLNPGYLYRPTPPDLLQRLDAEVGEGRRAWVISRLLTAFVDGKQPPTLNRVLIELDKLGRRHDG